MLNRRSRLPVGAVCSLAVVLLGPSTAAAAPPQPPLPQPPSLPTVNLSTGEIELPATGDWAPAPDEVVVMGASPPITAGGCTYRQVNDNPHLTGSPIDVSVHGWWTRDSGTCPSKNNVTVGLQAFWCDFVCRWITVDTGGPTSYFQGPGSGKWANARSRCAPATREVGWRGWTDVDLIGISDPSGRHYGSAINYWCTPG